MDPNLDLKTILDLHRKWIYGEPGGERANLQGANLQDADLQGANLQRAYLQDANLQRAYLQGANLQRASLQDANLQRAYLQDANLQDANLQRAYLQGANLQRASLQGANLQDASLQRASLQGASLQGANLQGANLWRASLQGASLQGANLQGANLWRADLQGAAGAELALAIASHLPEGQFDGWKKCLNGVMVRVRIPAEARRSHGASRKCRAEYVEVVEVIGAEVGISSHDRKTEYRVGQTVRAHAWDEDRWNTCAPGIHFFITRAEAQAYEV